ncbi:MAG TPA: four helix bundle protein [Verrucomicrobiae bacterium]|jgi:four helix bundle protein
MPTVRQFEELNVWQDARRLVNAVYGVSKSRAFGRDFGLRDQIRRAAVSAMSNIAEGFERGTKKEFVQFLNIAKGSNGEVRSQLCVALDQEYIDEVEFNSLRELSAALSKKLSAFIRYLESYATNARIKKPLSAAANQQSATSN